MLSYKDMKIGQRFKHFRLQAGLSQAELTEGICSVAVVSHIETDRSVPSAHTMGKLAERLRVPLQEIMGETESLMDVNYQIEVIRVYLAKQEFEHALGLIIKLDERNDLLDHQSTDLFVCHAEALVKLKRNSEAIALLLPFLEKQQIHQSLDDETLCDLYNKLGNAHYWSNDFEKAYSAFEQGYRISLKLPVFGPISARVTKNLGLTCNQVGLKEDAYKYLDKAHEFYERASDMQKLANTLFDMAIATGNVEYLRKAYCLYEDLNMVREANIAKQHYAFHIESKLDYKKAVEVLRYTADEFEKIGDLGMSVYTLSRAGMVCMQNDDINYSKSCMEIATARRNRMEHDNPLMLGYFYRVKSELNYKLKRFEECILDSEKSSEICAIMGMYTDSAESLQISAKVHELKGNIVKTNDVLKKVIDLLRKGQKRR